MHVGRVTRPRQNSHRVGDRVVRARALWSEVTILPHRENSAVF